MRISNPIIALAACFSAGCLPASFTDAVPWQIKQDRITDARTQAVTGMPFLRVDELLLDQLGAARRLSDADARQRIPELVGQCHTLAIQTAELETGRLAPAAATAIFRKCFATEMPPADSVDIVRSRYLDNLNKQYAAYFDQNISGATAESLRYQAALICQRAEPSVKNQHGSGMLLEMVKASHSSRPGTRPSTGSGLVVYEPGPLVKDDLKSAFDDQATRTLLEQFAPTIAQEIPAHSNYSTNFDRIGSVTLRGRPDNVTVVIQTDRPGAYSYARKVIINNREHDQLIYCYWFPEHPPVKPGDPEAGPIDGATLRITLDSQKRPAIVEVVQNCGCHYRCFAARYLDEQARTKYGVASDKDLSALTRGGAIGVEVIADDIFDVPDGPQHGPIVFSPAASHVPVGISFRNADLTSRTIDNRISYELHPYELLESMPTDFGRASMFGPDGLVHNAGRPEGWLMAGTGMLSAGQPRQRGTQLICWDKRSFDDPHLLEETLRLPPNF